MTTDNTRPTTHAVGVSLDTEQARLVRDSAARLQREFDGTFNAETIERYIHTSQQRLTSMATISMWLPVLIERVTRERLTALARLDSAGVLKPAVLFLCDHNAGRSQIAAGWMRHLAGDRVEVFSGGSAPAADTNESVVESMRAVGIDISTEYPKPWSDEVAATADVIVTMGCGDACPIIDGKRYLDWDLLSPTGVAPDVLAEIRDDIRTRVEALIASLGVMP